MSRSISILYILAFFGTVFAVWMIRYSLPFQVGDWPLPLPVQERFLDLANRYVGTWSLVYIGTYPLGVLCILCLERLFPADPKQKLLSVGLVQDAVWELLRTLFELLIIIWYVKLLAFYYERHLSFLTISSVEHFPVLVRLALAVLVYDFLSWFRHYLSHKISWLWFFHAIHHSQRELNLFTHNRNHFVDMLVARTFTVLPLLIVGLSVPNIVAFALFREWQGRLQHSNIRSSFGPLKYLLVSPQSHRIHHSLAAEHHDKNFGSILSVWDYLFGTQHRQYADYPPTGVADPHFPLENSGSLGTVLVLPIRQTFYPFRQVYQRASALFGRLKHSKGKLLAASRTLKESNSPVIGQLQESRMPQHSRAQGQKFHGTVAPP